MVDPFLECLFHTSEEAWASGLDTDSVRNWLRFASLFSFINNVSLSKLLSFPKSQFP